MIFKKKKQAKLLKIKGLKPQYTVTKDKKDIYNVEITVKAMDGYLHSSQKISKEEQEPKPKLGLEFQIQDTLDLYKHGKITLEEATKAFLPKLTATSYLEPRPDKRAKIEEILDDFEGDICNQFDQQCSISVDIKEYVDKIMEIK